MKSLNPPAETKTQQKEEEMKEEKSSDLQKAEQAVGSEPTAIPESYSESEIFSMMNRKSLKVQELRKEIIDIENKIADFQQKKDEFAKKIRPVRRLKRKYNPNGVKFEKIPSRDRKTIKLEIGFIENQLILLKDQLADRNAGLGKEAKTISNDVRKDKLVNKAQSNDWTKRNKRFVEARLLKTLNTAITTNKEELQELSKLASSQTENAKEEFSKALQNFLDEVDVETSILCSHQLRSVLYEAIRLTLMEWDFEETPEFQKLIVPEKK